MTMILRTTAAVLTIGFALGTGAALGQQSRQAQQRQEQEHHRMMEQHHGEPGMRQPGGGMMEERYPGMRGRGLPGPGMEPRMMDPSMAGMEEMMERMEHMMERMRQGMRMRRGMDDGEGLLVPDFGMRVTQVMHLSADDVRRYLARQLDEQGFERLQVGTVEEVDDETISAEIVTVDDSLVTRLEVDRYTGLISRGG